MILCQVMNLLLGGAAVQGSRKLLTAWLVWHLALVLLYWTWWASIVLIVVALTVSIDIDIDIYFRIVFSYVVDIFYHFT